ncbi:tyrosine-type recombinase/integrase [Xanthobacter sp. V0B-10]|uniref:tyrosine-type recombinase/integrase n=1 Tax=Xanthobacter albus TaxID=3119929 RepID=UPI0037274B00
MSVRKRSWKTSKGVLKQAWVADYVDQSGKRHIKSFERKKDAEAYQAAARVEVSAGTHTADSTSITVAEAAALWLETARQNGLEPATIDAYRQHVNLHINPFIGRVKLSQLTIAGVREFEDHLQKGDEPGLDPSTPPRPRSQPMVRRVRVSLGALLADAQERGLVARNVVRDLRARRTRGKELHAEKRRKGKIKVGVDIPTREEVRAILAAAEGRWKPLLQVAVFAGLRASELRGLRWQDIDFSARQLHVSQRADNRKRIGPPKSAAGARAVPLPPLLVNVLREWKLACPKSELGLVFPTGAGQVEYHSNILTRGFMPAQVASGVVVPVLDANGKPTLKEGEAVLRAKYTGLHSMRHFYASWCINPRADGGLGLTPKAVQERLGHSSITMTMDVYGHLFPRADEAEELADAERSLLG